jgi:hypothetical protein
MAEADERAKRARRVAHEWSRAVSRKKARKLGSTPKLTAMHLADYACLVTAEIASEWRLPRACIETIAAWPSLQTLAKDMGQSERRNIGDAIAVLASEGFLVERPRRGARLSTVHVLAFDGVALDLTWECPPQDRTADGSEVADLPPRFDAEVANPPPRKRDCRSGESATSDETEVADPPNRSGNLDGTEVADPPPNPSSDPFKYPERAQLSRAREASEGSKSDTRAEAGTPTAPAVSREREPRGSMTDGDGGRGSGDTALGSIAELERLQKRARRLLRNGYDRRYRERFGEPFFSWDAVHSYVRDVIKYCVDAGEAELERRVDAALDGFFARDDEVCVRQRYPWKYLAERPGAYAAEGRGETRKPWGSPRKAGRLPPGTGAGFSTSMEIRAGDWYRDDDVAADARSSGAPATQAEAFSAEHPDAQIDRQLESTRRSTHG